MSSREPGWEGSLGDLAVPGDVVASKYRIDRIIGTGGMGVVVEAFHLSFQESVAIKLLLPQVVADEEARERFEREARAAFKLESEHVARVMDVGKFDGTPFMVMELLEGQDLAEMLAGRDPMDIERAVTFVLQATDAVAEAHALGIVHRDLKPENLFVTTRADGSACLKVLDFGLSKVQRAAIHSPQPRSVTATTQAMGTPQYMSPEQWMSARDVGPASDQWALGVILFELITGRQPFRRDNLAQLCNQVLRGEPDTFAEHRGDVPAGLQAVVRRALAKAPEDRYQDLAGFALDLVPFAPSMRATVRRIKGNFQGSEVRDLPMSEGHRATGDGAREQMPKAIARQPRSDEPLGGPPSGELASGRLVTPQSWHQEALAPPPERRLPMVAGAAVAAVLLIAVLVIASVSGGAERSPAAPQQAVGAGELAHPEEGEGEGGAPNEDEGEGPQ